MFYGGIVMSFPERLRLVRKSKNLTQKQICDAIGMSEPAYQRYEYGDREPAYKYLIALANFFDVSIDYLAGRTDNPNSHKIK